jgi:hypothetical protein
MLTRYTVMFMDRDRVVRTWIFRGLCDLYFAFECDDKFKGGLFEDYERFAEISGLEKFLKALLLFHKREEYESLSDSQAREKLDSLARSIGHNFREMLASAATHGVDVSGIYVCDFDGYNGSQLVKAVQAGYMETRYPVPKPVSDAFPIPDSDGWTRDPLSSSGITKFVYAVCAACFFKLAAAVDFSNVCSDFRKLYASREPFHRFNNLLWGDRCNEFLAPR